MINHDSDDRSPGQAKVDAERLLADIRRGLPANTGSAVRMVGRWVQVLKAVRAIADQLTIDRMTSTPEHAFDELKLITDALHSVAVDMERLQFAIKKVGDAMGLVAGEEDEVYEGPMEGLAPDLRHALAYLHIPADATEGVNKQDLDIFVSPPWEVQHNPVVQLRTWPLDPKPGAVGLVEFEREEDGIDGNSLVMAAAVYREAVELGDEDERVIPAGWWILSPETFAHTARPWRRWAPLPLLIG